MRIIDLQGELPSGWEVRRLRHVTLLRTSNVDKKVNDGEQPVRLCNYTDVYYSAEIADASTFMEATATPDEIRRFRLRRGDVLVTKDSETADDIAVPAYVARDFDDVVCGYHLAIYRPNGEVVGKYLYYALLTDRVGDQFTIGANGITRFGLSQDVLKDAKVPLPDVETQRAIASFLDRETARIDTLIEKKRRLLDLLEEERTTLITQAVTRGLDADVPMKDSGLEWIGQVPNHWEVVELRRAVRLVTSGSRKWADYYADDGALFVRIGNLGKRTPDLDLSDSQLVDVPPGPEAERSRVRAGDLLVSITALVGAVAVVPHGLDAYVNQHVALCRLKNTKVNSRFVAYFLLSRPGQAIVRLPVYGGTKEGLALDDVKGFRVTLPPHSEQDEIVRHLDRQLSRLEEIGTKTSSAISLLREYRTSLISFAVTGKIDVTERALTPA